MNKNKPTRYGSEWAKLNYEPYQLRLNPEFNGTLWQIDGTRIQIPYLAEGRKIRFLYIFVVMDVHSRKIIGFSVDTSEQKQMIIKSIENAVKTVGYIPKEMVRDSGPPMQSVDFKYLEDYMRFLGTYCRKHIPAHPQDKAHVERFFGTFQSTVLKNEKGYVGEGIKSTKESGRPDPEVVLESRKSKNLRTKIELELLIEKCVEKYNSTRVHSDVPSPNAKFEHSNIDKNATKISSNEEALLFWKHTQVKVKKSMIILTQGSRSQIKHQYIIYDEALRNTLNQTDVKICYQKNDRRLIKVFDENDGWITDLSLKIPIPIVYDRKLNLVDRPIKKTDSENSGNKVVLDTIKVEINPEHQLYKQKGTNEEIK